MFHSDLISTRSSSSSSKSLQFLESMKSRDSRPNTIPHRESRYSTCLCLHPKTLGSLDYLGNLEVCLQLSIPLPIAWEVSTARNNRYKRTKRNFMAIPSIAKCSFPIWQHLVSLENHISNRQFLCNYLSIGVKNTRARVWDDLRGWMGGWLMFRCLKIDGGLGYQSIFLRVIRSKNLSILVVLRSFLFVSKLFLMFSSTFKELIVAYRKS